MNRILIVDDSPTALMWQQLLLRLEGYEVLDAPTAEDGLRIARRERPDLIVMDIAHPPMAGFTACRLLRSEPETMDIPILMATSLSDVDNVIAGFEAGCNDFLTKPLERAEYLGRIRNQLSRHLCGAA